MSSIIENYVEQQFRELPPGKLCRSPILGGSFVPGEDPAEPEIKELSRRALVTREWFSLHGPPDAPPLPLSGIERSDLKYKNPFGHLVTQFSNSLEANGWDMNSHPSFEAYARGVIASPLAADIVRTDETILKRYPPRKLRYILSGMIWRPVSS